MSSEYDYSGLYNNTSGGGQNPPQQNNPQPAQPQQSAQAPQQPAQDNAYPNVGSSGANTANTARTDYSTGYGSANPNPQQDNSGYTSSFSGGNGGNNGGYNGYRYFSAPQQPPVPQKKKPNKVLLRVLACVGVAALGLGGGLGGAVVASRAGLTGNQVVVQQVQRSTGATAAGSTDGTSMSVQQIASVVSPSVVAITTEQMVSTNTWFGGSYVQSGAGSGVIISQDGYIITCAHVVSGANNITVQLADGTEYSATIVGQDSTSDVAVLKIEATGLTPAVIGDSDSLAVGETTIAVGNPLGTLSNTVTNGIVSALNREVTVQGNDMNLIQTSASISPGNSGGGLFNANGELIGIVNAKSSSSDAEGLGFAIPINTAMEMAKQMIEKGYVARPAMGVTVITINDAQTAMQYGVSNYGVYIYQIASGSGAEKGGLKLGDRIISIDDVAVSSASDVQKYCQSKEVGDTVTLQVERDGKVISCEVTLGESTQSTATAESGN